MSHFDALETRSADQRDAEQLAALKALGVEDLAARPVLRKSELAAMQKANADLAEAKANGKTLKRIGASVRAAAAFVNLFTIPAVKHEAPASVRMEPAY
jgi:hypothetical protein